MSQPSPGHLAFKILLVENSRTAQAVLLNQLESRGYAVTIVSSGSEAVESIDKLEFDLIIMDVYLPQLNGYEAAKQIRALGKEKSELPLIALTASDKERDKKLCMDAGMNEYIIKTQHNEVLLETLERYKNQRPAVKTSQN